MKALNVGKILFLFMTTLLFTSCGDEYYTDDYLRNSDEKLCSKTWVEEYETTNRDLCKHYLTFSRSHSGKETIKYFRAGESSSYKELSWGFSWSWIDNSMEGLEINYGGDDIIYFDNIWVREHNLSGKLDGVNVVFVDADYYK